MTRAFDATRDLVFDALTKPELVKRWLLGPPGWSMPICEIDLKVGGAYRYVWRHEDGREMGMGGTYREIVRPERLVNTELFDKFRRLPRHHAPDPAKREHGHDRHLALRLARDTRWRPRVRHGKRRGPELRPPRRNRDLEQRRQQIITSQQHQENYETK
ncbi:MAG TPA: SRPBCC domain-containing protein [Chthoniobacterales bacterium]|nr:SRPBCC domain-containing protein [Chthoniobacterales bacterium]